MGAKEAAEKPSSAYNHPGAQGATTPESGGELLKPPPSSAEEWESLLASGQSRMAQNWTVPTANSPG